MLDILGNGWPLLAVASLFGLLVGSFLNVVILRLPAQLMYEWRQQARELLESDSGADGAAAGLAVLPDGTPQTVSLPSDTSTVETHAPADSDATGNTGTVAADATQTAALPPAGAAANTDNTDNSAAATTNLLAAAVAVEAAADAPAAAELPPPDLVFKGSHCLQCKHPLSPLDNIPLLSWLMLGGRCRYCKTPISAQYPIVEALTAVAALIVVWRFGFSLQAAAGLVLTFSLIALSGIDLRTQLLPDQITLPLLWLGLLLTLQPVFVAPSDAILAAAIGYLSLWSVYWGFKKLTGKEGMGYGDFKLLAALGAWMGTVSLLPIVLLSSLVGAIVGGLYLVLRRQDSSTPIPFGPFIAAAGWLQFVWGEHLLRWYEQLLLA
ncbi:prepilin signal peptidase PulO-like enzyme (type II secretory pathway) [Tahibacter aquaticus]|uniref:Prepilin leader peptidase/N-methyltransferase n=1 Tax=Tahibacter aquaticus TaxID=520092 RepID=A0A4R6ZA08_9GAMM|nr:prepilin signal peptidase PulO-like enzyme (type II secretory pathway) [Tahibacter aquaticus]